MLILMDDWWMDPQFTFQKIDKDSADYQIIEENPYRLIGRFQWIQLENNNDGCMVEIAPGYQKINGQKEPDSLGEYEEKVLWSLQNYMVFMNIPKLQVMMKSDSHICMTITPKTFEEQPKIKEKNPYTG